jgi:hypothetical protein
LNRDWVLFHLREARGAISATIADIESTPDYGYAEFWVAMQHLYHHLNTAWNARDALPSQVDPGTDADFNRWSQLPTDLPMMRVRRS